MLSLFHKGAGDWLRRGGYLLIFSLAGGGQGANVLAADFTLTALLRANQIYDSNIFMADDQDTDAEELSDFLTTITPGVELNCATPRGALFLGIRQAFAQYAQYSEMNRVDQSYSAKLDYALSELSSVGLNFGYDVDHGADRDLEDTGLLLGTNKRIRLHLGGEAHYILNEKTQAILGYGFTQSDYSSGSSDSKTNNLSLTINREVGWLPGGYLYASTGFLHYETESARQRNISAVLGCAFQLSEGVSLNIDAGVRKSREQYRAWQLQWLTFPPFYRIVAVEKEEGNWGKVGHFRLGYQGEFTNANLLLSYDMQPASGRDTMTERTQVSFDLSRRFSEELSIRGFSSYFLNFRDGADQRYHVDETTVHLGCDVTYDLNSFFSVNGQYRHSWVADDEEGAEASRDRFLLSLVYKYPLLQ